MDLLVYILALHTATAVETGPLSVYRPGDGHNSGELACGGQFTDRQIHIAHRRWKLMGCGRPVLVVSRQTGQWALAVVRDAGPFGIVEVGKVKPKWRVWTKSLRAPAGWRWRGAVDLSYGLWLRLGRPRFLTKATIYTLPRNFLSQCEDLLGGQRSPRLVQSPTTGLDQLAQALQYMQLRRRIAHLPYTSGADAYFLGYGTVVEPQYINATYEVSSYSGTVPGFYIPYGLGHRCSMTANCGVFQPRCRVDTCLRD